MRKSNRRTRFILMAVLTLLAASTQAPIADAQSVQGSFDLPVAVRWAEAKLPAGHYNFIVRSASNMYMVVLRGNGHSSMIIDSGGFDTSRAKQSALEIAGSGSTSVVRSLTLACDQLVLYYSAPKLKNKVLGHNAHGAEEAAVMIPVH